ncbi:hypothetical protein KUTeg_023248, partial [Tegillarca granosa]
MKGKGKGMTDKDCPLQFPDLEPVDHIKQCPKYSSVLNRSEDDGIGVEELDQIQSDLETLLASAGLRLKQLEQEKQILVNWQDKKDETPTSGKRGKGSDDKPSKKFKESSSSVGKAAFPTPAGPGRPKSKISQSKINDLDTSVDSPIDLPKVPKNDAINGKRRSNNNNNSFSNDNDTTLLKKADQSLNVEESPFGPLTQRLVSALIEENIMTSVDDTMEDITGGKGILDLEDKVEDNPDDEILTELKQKQQELKALSQHNIVVVKNLLERAKEEMKKQDLRKKLAAVDAEVLEAYRRVQLSRQKKKPPTKKERDSVFKALKEREALVRQIEGKT